MSKERMVSIFYGRLEGNKMKDTYVIKVDKICSYCGAKNEINTVVEQPVDVIACGRCGEYIMLPEDITDEENEKLTNIISDVIRGEA